MSQPTARALTPDEQEAFRLTRLLAAERQPYFARALFAASPVAAPGLGTFAVDRWWRLYIDPDALAAWSTDEGAAVLIHEVGHLLREHGERVDALARPHHPLAWNLAADAEINDDLLAAGVPLPEGVVTPAALGQPPNGLAETYYAAILPPPGAPDLPDDGGPGCGSGAGTGPVPGEMPEGTDLTDGAAPALDPAAADLVRRRVADDVRAHIEAKGRGTVPAATARWASDVLAPPTIPWQRLLRAAVRRAVADRAGRVTYTYARPSRRRLPRIIKPAMRAPSVTVSIVVDTSGSMSPDDLTAAVSEISGVLSANGIDRHHLRLLSCDAAATTARPIRSIRDVTLTGGGGTDMRIGIDAASANRPAPDVIIVLTDGYTPWPSTPTRAHLICAIIGPDGHTDGTPEWATTVHVPHTGNPA